MKQFPLYYKGRALMRVGNILYYGDMSEKYIVMMQVQSSEKNQDIDISGKIKVELQYTDPEIKASDRAVNSATRVGLFAAVDLASVWLERALAGK